MTERCVSNLIGFNIVFTKINYSKNQVKYFKHEEIQGKTRDWFFGIHKYVYDIINKSKSTPVL